MCLAEFQKGNSVLSMYEFGLSSDGYIRQHAHERMRILALVQSRSGFRVYFELNTIITFSNFYSTPETLKSSVL
jgi:hypothetical protein